jgi:hypothetical protein
MNANQIIRCRADYVPDGAVETHRVSNGEDWASVAQQYNVNVKALGGHFSMMHQLMPTNGLARGHYGIPPTWRELI